MNIFISFLVGIGLVLITAFGDAFIKQASLQKDFTGLKWLILGALLYASTAFGWFFVLRKIKLSTSVVLYSVSLITFSTLLSVLYFKEKITPVEIIAILMAIFSLIILYRFA